MSRPWVIDRYEWPESAPWKSTTRSPILRFAFNRGATEPIPVKFIDAGVVQELGSTATVGFGLKATRQSTSWLITPSTAAKTGTTTSTIYTLSPQIMGSALDTALGTSDSLACVLELYWTDSGTGGTAGAFGTGSIQKSAVVYKNLNTGSETVPITPAAFTDIGTVTNATSPTYSSISAANGNASFELTANAGTGTYTYKVVLITTGMTSGAIAEGKIITAASANPTVEIRNASTSGTLLDTIPGDSSNANTYHFEARFNGTAWEKWEGEYEVN
jgi:hypothetical protein